MPSLEELKYNSGDLFLPHKIKDFLETNIIGSYNQSFYITYWSLLHLISGVISGFIYIYLGLPMKYYTVSLLLLHMSWELWQINIGMSKPHKTVGKNNIYDILLDTLLFEIGAKLTKTFYS